MNRQWNVVECPECGGSGKVTREAEATRTADRPSLRQAAERLVALETSFSGAPKYGHLPDGPIDAGGYCRVCARAEPYDGWHERAESIAALRQALEGEDR